MPPMPRESSRPGASLTSTPTQSPNGSAVTASASTSRSSARHSHHSQSSPTWRASHPAAQYHIPNQSTLSDISDFPTQWGDDLWPDEYIFPHQLTGAAAEQQFLNEFATAEFSSPSTYPAFIHPPPNQVDSLPEASPSRNPRSAPRRTLSARTSGATSRTTTQLDSCGVHESPNTSFSIDSILNTGSQSSSSSFSDAMPATRRATRVRADATANKRQKMEDSPSNPQSAAAPLVLPSAPEDDEDDLFGDKFMDQPPSADGEGLTTIDLTEANAVPDDLKRPDIDNRIKISKFQCVICMDDATTLTVTHCGHLYCAECLHSSLHVEATRGKCPMCRAKIDMKPRSAYTTKTKGFWPLELKLMTATKKGKRKADDIA